MATKYVDGTNGNDSNGGDSSADAYATITKAVTVIDAGTAADNKSIIIIHSGTYAEGPIDGSSKDFISIRTAGDGLVSIKHDGTNTSGNNTLELGESWDLTGNGLDLAIFTKQFDGGTTVNHDTDCFAVKIGTHGDSNVPFTASSVAFVGQKYLRGSIHTNESFGDALDIRPFGTASNCIFMHLTTVGGSRSGTARLSLVGSLIYNTGTTSSAQNGVYVPDATHSLMINNTFSHCTGSPGLVYYAPKRMMNNLFVNCTSFGTLGGGATANYLLREATTTTLGNAVGATSGPTEIRRITVTTAPTVWKDSSDPSGQYTSAVTNLQLFPTASGGPVGFVPGEVMVLAGKTFSEGGAVPPPLYSNAIFHTIQITGSVFPHGGKSTNFEGGLASPILTPGINGRSIAETGPATDLFCNSWPDETHPPIGCFSKYVAFAKEPEIGRDSTDVVDGDFTINNHDEVRKSRFRNVDTSLFSESTKAVTNLRGRQTSYRVTTTKT